MQGASEDDIAAIRALFGAKAEKPNGYLTTEELAATLGIGRSSASSWAAEQVSLGKMHRVECLIDGKRCAAYKVVR